MSRYLLFPLFAFPPISTFTFSCETNGMQLGPQNTELCGMISQKTAILTLIAGRIAECNQNFEQVSQDCVYWRFVLRVTDPSMRVAVKTSVAWQISRLFSPIVRACRNEIFVLKFCFSEHFEMRFYERNSFHVLWCGCNVWSRSTAYCYCIVFKMLPNQVQCYQPVKLCAVSFIQLGSLKISLLEA
jgi:hypothetical protein